ncbi:MAG: hypothetical protein CMN30_24905 [Sandaracinus sp.]|nr:hypothetical protein [Sandaracinus sp.]
MDSIFREMTRRVPFLLLSLLVTLGCGDDDETVVPDAGTDAFVPGADAEPDAAADLGTDAGREDGCMETTGVAEWRLDNIDDTGVRIRGDLGLELGESPWGLHVWFQRYGDTPYEGVVELGPDTANESFPHCPHCVVALSGADEVNPMHGFFARSGTIELVEDAFSPRKHFILRDVVLGEITIEGIESTWVPDGDCIALPAMLEVEQAFPPEAWRCDPNTYGAGDACDCGCGTWDPDCFPCDGILGEECDEEPLPVRGCDTGQVCGGLEARCYQDCSETGTCEVGTCVWEGLGNRICDNDPDHFDPAQLGEECGPGAYGATYCGEQPGYAEGVCSEWFAGPDEPTVWECRAFCQTDADCDTENHEYCEVVYGEVAGYCLPDYPRYWTCDPTAYEDGVCNCECGAPDPDCGLPQDLPASSPDCAADQVCVFQGQFDTLGQTECISAVVNDDCASAETVTLPFTGTVDTRGAHNSYLAASCFRSERWGLDSVYAMDLTAGEAVDIEFTTTDDDTNAALYVVGPGDAALCDTDFTCEAAVDDGWYGEGETFRFTATDAGRYFLVVDCFANRLVRGQLSISAVE